MAKTKKSNILITGASGFIGRKLARGLLNRGYKIFLVGKKEGFKFPGAKTLVGNLKDYKFCQRIVKQASIVYYLAGYKKNIAYHKRQPFEFFYENVAAFLDFLSAAKESKIKKIVYLSSTLVNYLDQENQPTDGYLLGKYANELALQSFARQTNIDVKIVRASAVYGPGDNFNADSANFIPATINKVSHLKAGQNLVVWGKGLRKLQFIYVNDLVANLIKVKDAKGNFFEFGNPQAASVNQIVKKIIELSGKAVTVKNDLTKPDKKTQLITFRNLVKPRVNLNRGLAVTFNSFKTNG